MESTKGQSISQIYLENITLLNKAISALDKMDSRLSETAPISISMASLRAQRLYLIEGRIELEMQKLREEGELPLTYSWWFYPKHDINMVQKMQIPFILYETTNKFNHWIDAVTSAIDIAKKNNLLCYSAQGDFVLILSNNSKKYSVISARTALGNYGSLPDLHSDGSIPASTDKNFLVKSMQRKWSEITDCVDGPTGFPFILLKPTEAVIHL
jgi:hypothetical protein